MEAMEKLPAENRERNERVLLWHHFIRRYPAENSLENFFIEKSQNTQTINNSIRRVTVSIGETETLFSALSPEAIESVRNYISAIDGQPKNEEIIGKQLRKKIYPYLDKLRLSVLKQIIHKPGGLMSLREIFENKLNGGNGITAEKFSLCADIRDTSFFLSPEREAGWKSIAFDMQQLIDNGFVLYEANLNEADNISKDNKLGDELPFAAIKNYIQSLRKINNVSDRLDYETDIHEDYDAAETKFSYYPYMPEYLLQPPDKESIVELFQKNMDKVLPRIKKFLPGVVPADLLVQPVSEENYQTMVNLLFNSAIAG